MIYKHQYFILDTDSRKVFDENKKELRLTGNSFRLLVFLCEKKNANITEIGDYLDWAKDYNEDHIRQYRYKINTIIGNDVVLYKNSIYSLVGDVKELKDLKDLDTENRNTDLLQGDEIKLEKNNKNNIMNKIKINYIPAIVSVILLLLTLLDWPYGYYTFLRFVITGIAIYYAYCIFAREEWRSLWFWGLLVIIILFNPVVPVHLGIKIVWSVIDIIVSMFFIGLIIKYKNK